MFFKTLFIINFIYKGDQYNIMTSLPQCESEGHKNRNK